jgi:hypothetical protein
MRTAAALVVSENYVDDKREPGNITIRGNDFISHEQSVRH